ncbi:MAG: transcriptional regulator, partial [Pseudomonadota bacterium]
MPESDPPLSRSAPFRVSGHDVEPAALRVSGDGSVVRLEPKTMQVLVYLADHAGRVISRGELEDAVWRGRIVGEDALTNAIVKLRRALGDDARNPRVIETLPKTGYRLIAAVERADTDPESLPEPAPQPVAERPS